MDGIEGWAREELGCIQAGGLFEKRRWRFPMLTVGRSAVAVAQWAPSKVKVETVPRVKLPTEEAVGPRPNESASNEKAINAAKSRREFSAADGIVVGAKTRTIRHDTIAALVAGLEEGIAR